MRVALPLFGDDIAPRFWAASELLIVDISGGREISRRKVVFSVCDGSAGVALLGKLEVTHLLCGGFNRRFLAQAEFAGIEVIFGLWGRAEVILDAFSLKRSFQSQSCPGDAGEAGGTDKEVGATDEHSDEWRKYA